MDNKFARRPKKYIPNSNYAHICFVLNTLSQRKQKQKYSYDVNIDTDNTSNKENATEHQSIDFKHNVWLLLRLVIRYLRAFR